MHQQGWVRGDYSDIVVSLSGIYGEIRGDKDVKERDDTSQSFMRSTTKVRKGPEEGMGARAELAPGGHGLHN